MQAEGRGGGMILLNAEPKPESIHSICTPRAVRSTWLDTKKGDNKIE
jgi:hypothetical protein